MVWELHFDQLSENDVLRMSAVLLPRHSGGVSEHRSLAAHDVNNSESDGCGAWHQDTCVDLPGRLFATWWTRASGFDPSPDGFDAHRRFKVRVAFNLVTGYWSACTSLLVSGGVCNGTVQSYTCF